MGAQVGLIGQFVEQRFLTLTDLDNAMDRALFGLPASTGVDVSPSTALTSTAVYACVGLIAETIASLPFIVYRRLSAGGKERAPSHPLYKILHDAPNDEMTAYEFWECQVGHLCLWGNAYAEIERSDRGVRGLWPLRPDRMSLGRTTDGALYYEYRLPDGTTKKFAKQQIMHLRGLSSNGVIGFSPIVQAREAIGLSLATEKYGAKFFGNASRPGGVLQAPQGAKLSQGAMDRLKADWERMHQGLDNSHRVAILEEGITWQAIGIPPNDAQFLETRRYQLGEIARIYRIPPHMIGDVERTTSWGTGIEQQSLGFLTYTLLPWLTRIEQRVYQDLFSNYDPTGAFAEHLVDGLLRGDAVTRAQAMQIWRQNGVINANEWRERENLNPLPGTDGNTYWMPSNMTTADAAEAARKLAEKKLTEPAPQPVPPQLTPEPANKEADNVQDDTKQQ